MREPFAWVAAAEKVSGYRVVEAFDASHLRVHVQGQSRLLDKITEVVIRARRSGGRFEVDDHGVRLAADGSTVIRFTQ